MAVPTLLAVRLVEGIGLVAVIGGALLSGTAPLPGAAEALSGALLAGYGMYESGRLPVRSRYAPGTGSTQETATTVYRTSRNP